jgi:hypothetical protein
LNSFGAIHRLTYNLPFPPRGQQPSQCRANSFLVVNDQNSKGRHVYFRHILSDDGAREIVSDLQIIFSLMMRINSRRHAGRMPAPVR